MLRGRLEVVEADRDRLLALTAGHVEDAAVAHEKAPVSDDRGEVASEGLMGRLRRLVGR
jgi:hypothetical protein